MKPKNAVNDRIVFLTGVSSQENKWNGYYWENRIGNDIGELNRELKKQGFKIIKEAPNGK